MWHDIIKVSDFFSAVGSMHMRDIFQQIPAKNLLTWTLGHFCVLMYFMLHLYHIYQPAVLMVVMHLSMYCPTTPPPPPPPLPRA